MNLEAIKTVKAIVKEDASWIDDIAIMTREEHSQWHREYPDFCASDNIV